MAIFLPNEIIKSGAERTFAPGRTGQIQRWTGQIAARPSYRHGGRIYGEQSSERASGDGFARGAYWPLLHFTIPLDAPLQMARVSAGCEGEWP